MPGRRDGGRADSIDDLDLLRHGAMPALFGGVRVMDVVTGWTGRAACALQAALRNAGRSGPPV